MCGNGGGGGGGGAHKSTSERASALLHRSSHTHTDGRGYHTPSVLLDMHHADGITNTTMMAAKAKATGSRLRPAGNGTASGATAPPQREMLRLVLHQCQHGAVLAGGPGDACIGLLLANGGRDNLPTDSPQHAFHNLITSGTYMAGV